METKILAEFLQCHSCRAVCHDYGHKEYCFLFPHEVYLKSDFDPNTNAITLMCKDPNINYFNPHLLVFCHHNHDIRCILSGKSAKAAMFYISDYITKNDEKMFQIMTLFSKAVAEMPDIATETAGEHAKCLIHWCISALF